MNLQDEWNSLSAELNNGKEDFTENQKMIQMEPKGTYETLIKHLKYKLVYIAVFSLASLAFALVANGMMRYLLLVFFAAFLLAGLMSLMQLKKLPASIDYTLISKSVVNQQLHHIKLALKLERYWGYVFIPLSPMGGYFISQAFLNKDLNTILYETNWCYKIPVFLLIGIVGIYLADKMNGVAFKNYIDKLERNQQHLEN